MCIVQTLDKGEKKTDQRARQEKQWVKEKRKKGGRGKMRAWVRKWVSEWVSEGRKGCEQTSGRFGSSRHFESRYWPLQEQERLWHELLLRAVMGMRWDAQGLCLVPGKCAHACVCVVAAACRGPAEHIGLRRYKLHGNYKSGFFPL